MRTLTIVALGCAVPATAVAQNVAPTPVVAPFAAEAVLPPHTEVVLRLDEEVASNRARVGQAVPVSVARDVVVDGMVLIPRGTAGVGAVTGRTGKGAFGKSGKIDIELRSIEVAGRNVPIVGRYHASGKGRAGETIGTILVGGVIAGAFVTGRHAVFEEGREFTAFTADAARIAAPLRRSVAPAALAIAAASAPRPIAAPVAYAGVASAPVYRASGYTAPLPQPVRYASIDPVSAPTDSRYDTLVRFERGLAAVQPVRAGDSRQGWKISD
ncbi:hypothetical protein LPN01_17595 [Sphingomonas sp. A2-49]|uniref:hypothetical protein n=1 Tax=Sphingomonas sp. A2-49 TaxID=1391375 RepID=UPI0021D03286|nr:hypothetical protein [Sphingomonas sp. A2-49]MCU6455896.1 hypothetical protein [Sphingomonas sp. A2-49]